MSLSNSLGWQPNKIKTNSSKRAPLTTSTAPVIVIMEDGDFAYIKTLGNPEGPDALICEYLGTSLAEWFQLPTLKFGIIDFDATLFPSKYKGGYKAESGQAFITKEERGRNWAGDAEDLKDVENKKDITRLVVFDCWTLNRDRHFVVDKNRTKRNIENVFFSEERTKKGYKLLSIDHSECFRRGSLSDKYLTIDRIKCTDLFGVFPEFIEHIKPAFLSSPIAKLRDFDKNIVHKILNKVPVEWNLRPKIKHALADFCEQRANFLAATLPQILGEHCRWEQRELSA